MDYIIENNNNGVKIRYRHFFSLFYMFIDLEVGYVLLEIYQNIGDSIIQII